MDRQPCSFAENFSISPQPIAPMQRNNRRHSRMRLYDRDCHRLYVNAHERRQFLTFARQRPMVERCFCEVLVFTGCRISEALALTAHNFQLEEQLISFRTLKQREVVAVREIPIPDGLTEQLVQLLARVGGRQSDLSPWKINDQVALRSTAYRWIKGVMHDAGVSGHMACPKGLRHGFGIHAVLSGVPLNMVQKWMGHSSIETTTIYADAVGQEERALAERMWQADAAYKQT